MRIRGVIFDLDGTVVETSYDWTGIRAELGTSATSILEYIDSLEEPDRSRKRAVLEGHEAAQTEAAVLREGVHELLGLLHGKGIAAALVTNNSRRNTAYLLDKFDLSFDCVITRESGLWKPSGAPFLEVLKKLRLEPPECCVVGDTHFDVLAALDAGIGAIFLLSEEPERFAGFPVEVYPDMFILREALADIID
jgi:HAD superfamily hydrolase (TIGR01509 family)